MPGFSQISVLTQHYDSARTGQNTQETILTHANVNPTQFGLLFTHPLDGQMTAQPLYVPNVFIPSLNATHNVVYAVTMHDGVYAFDADNNQGAILRRFGMSLFNPAGGVTSVPQSDEGCSVGYTEFGIQGTPAIDPTKNAIYIEAISKENGNYVHRLHALDLGTGAELFGGPTVISASVRHQWPDLYVHRQISAGASRPAPAGWNRLYRLWRSRLQHQNRKRLGHGL